jgi:hypothetical protein
MAITAACSAVLILLTVQHLLGRHLFLGMLVMQITCFRAPHMMDLSLCRQPTTAKLCSVRTCGQLDGHVPLQYATAAAAAYAATLRNGNCPGSCE